MNARVANACTGAPGLEARPGYGALPRKKRPDCRPATALVLSTGVIGIPLPIDKVGGGLRQAAAKLSSGGGIDAARAIMTTTRDPSTAPSPGGKHRYHDRWNR